MGTHGLSTSDSFSQRSLNRGKPTTQQAEAAETGRPRPRRQGHNNTKGKRPANAPGPTPNPVKPKGPQTFALTRLTCCLAVPSTCQNKVATSAENAAWRQWPTAGWPACGKPNLRSQNFKNTKTWDLWTWLGKEWVGRALPLDARRNLTHSRHTKHMQVTLKSPTARPQAQGALVGAMMFRL